jgi:hypothetical protein
MLPYDPAFVTPRYDGLSFAAIPTSIAGLLTGAAPVTLAPETLAGLPAVYRNVVVMLIDGFGWRFFEKYAGDYPALRRFTDDGAATRISSQFPSTTVAHVTTLHTGLPVSQHGMYEWQYYEPLVGSVIIPLLFSYAGTHDRDQLKAAKVDPRTILPTRTLYQGLNRLGVTSTIFQHKEYTPGTYADVVFNGAQARGYRTLAEAFVNLRAALADAKGPSYFALYFDRFDALAHEYGPNAPQPEAEADALLTSLERLILAKLPGRGDTLVLLTADHGEVEVDPATTININRDPRFAGYERFLIEERPGTPRVPAGAARDCFLYVKAGLLDEARAFFAERLEGVARVYRTADLLAAGYFGPLPASNLLLARLGNLVILPYRGQAVWWYEKGRFEQKFYGHHGGLTPEEMRVPLLALVL